CSVGEYHWMVVEYCANGDLLFFLRERGHELDLLSRTDIALGIATGLRVMHECGIVHRDLKSPNILLDDQLTPKIADFGLAKFNSKSILSSLPSEHIDKLGSVWWKAPELFRDEPQFSTKSDMFAFGVVVWEVFDGGLPYGGESNNTT